MPLDATCGVEAVAERVLEFFSVLHMEIKFSADKAIDFPRLVDVLHRPVRLHALARDASETKRAGESGCWPLALDPVVGGPLDARDRLRHLRQLRREPSEGPVHRGGSCCEGIRIVGPLVGRPRHLARSSCTGWRGMARRTSATLREGLRLSLRGLRAVRIFTRIGCARSRCQRPLVQPLPGTGRRPLTTTQALSR